MSRKPTIKLSYPDASTLAMQLTNAMIRRAPGKRVLETISEDKAGDGEGSLLDGLNSVRTSTGVEMTLTLEPNSMDYALQQLIRPNLTEEETKAIFGEDSTSSDQMPPGSAPAEDHQEKEKQIEIGKIPDGVLRDILGDFFMEVTDPDYPEHGKPSWDSIQDTINRINDAAGVIDIEDTYETDDNSKKTMILKRDIELIIQNGLLDHLPKLEDHNRIMIAEDLARRLNLHTHVQCDPNRGYDRTCIEIALAVLLCAAQEQEWDQADISEWAEHVNDMLSPAIKTGLPSYLDIDEIRNFLSQAMISLVPRGNVIKAWMLNNELSQGYYKERQSQAKPDAPEKETNKKQQKKTRKKKTAEKKDPSWDDVEAEAREIGQHKTDKTDEDQDGEIEAGLLNDIEDGEEGGA